MSALRLLLVSLALSLGNGEPNHGAGFKTIEAGEVREHVSFFGSPKLEGRDSPSKGLLRAAEYIVEHFEEAGLVPAPDSVDAWRRSSGGAKRPEWAGPAEGEGSFLRPYRVGSLGQSQARTPEPSKCSLELELEGEATTFEYGQDFVPLLLCDGNASGELVFAGFAIESTSHKYSDFRGKDVKGKVALIFDGEPRHKRKFGGPILTVEASLFKKLEHLEDKGAAGAIVVRRPRAETAKSAKNDELEPTELGFRYTFATWNSSDNDRPPREMLPAVEVTLDCASALLGTDAGKLAAKMDKSAKPTKVDLSGRRVSLEAYTNGGGVTVHNVVGLVPGSDLAEEFVVVGAHYDHIGVGPRGRVGPGADDNGSGSAALLEIAEAMGVAKPRRSVLLCAFSAEEDGLVGARELCKSLPVDKSKIVAMVNLDMIGRGETREVVTLGFKQHPAMKKIVDRAKKLSKTGVRKITVSKDDGLFQRSDHFPFHEIGVPVVFFFEGVPISKNRDYHTWRDTVEHVDMEKVTFTARLAFNTAWILANDDEKPPRPPE